MHAHCEWFIWQKSPKGLYCTRWTEIAKLFLFASFRVFKAQKLCKEKTKHTYWLIFTVSLMILKCLCLTGSTQKRIKTFKIFSWHLLVFALSQCFVELSSGDVWKGLQLRGSYCWVALQSSEPPAVLLLDSICSVSEPEGCLNLYFFYYCYTYYSILCKIVQSTVDHRE